MSKATIKGLSKKVLLVILDGYGINPKSPKNAILAAKHPNIDELFAHYPNTTIESGGPAVGLPKDVAGNSEVGHLNIGSGRPVRQDLVRINEAVKENTLKDLPKFQELISKTRETSKRLHIMGLLSNGGVHSHIDHIKHIIKVLGEVAPDVTVFFHAYMDGRDTPPASGIDFVKDLLTLKNFHFASMQGRSIGMDRDQRWEKVEHAYKMFTGKDAITNLDPVTYLQGEYDKKIFDEFVTPVLFNKDYAIKSEDSLFFVNFRPDRAKEISLAFNHPKFDKFPRDVMPHYYLCMSPYLDYDELPLPILFDKENIKGTLSEYFSKLGVKQFKIAETEKYAHVTYFFNGGEEKAFPGEDRVLVSSPKEVKTYDEKPEMSAYPVAEKLVAALEKSEHDFYLVNFANADMVGHTGNYDAAVKAVEAVDSCVGKLMQACQTKGITMLITADHGNADQMEYPNGTPHTSHTNAPVPFIVFSPALKDATLELTSGPFALKDIAPTVLYVMDVKKPEDFAGNNIFA